MHDAPRRLEVRTLDERLSLAGSALGALALVWLVYGRLLALSGVLGFVVLWFAAYLVLYSLVTLQSHPGPVVLDRLAAAVVAGAAVVVGLALATTLGFIFVKGFPALSHPGFFTHDMSGVRPTSPLSQGGVLHAVVGTALEVVLAVAVSMPLGVATAVYMTEVGGRLSRTVRTVVEAMTALPDILAGLFVYTVLIIGMHGERTGVAAALALSVTMVPIVARSSEVALRIVPGGLREASLALGASQWQTVRRVVLPTARVGLVTSLVLGVARIAGETAPLLIVSGASTFLNTDPTHQPMNSLPLFAFSAVRSGQDQFIARGYGAAALLLALVLVLFVTARYLARDTVRAR
jgi:phosphate transport system permease protein